MTFHLHIRTDARQHATGEPAACFETLERIPVQLILLLKLLDSATLVVECYRMKIDAMAETIAHDDTGREFIFGDAEAHGRQLKLHRLPLRDVNHKIEIIVLTSLSAKEHVDAPS